MTETMNFEQFKRDIMEDGHWFPIWVSVDPNWDGSNFALAEIMYPSRWREKNRDINIVTESRDDGHEIYDWAIRCHEARIKKIEDMKKELDSEGW